MSTAYNLKFLPRPSAAQIKVIRAKERAEAAAARRALSRAHFDAKEYARALGELRVLRSWLNVYVDNRADT